jgi:transposase InsO family protein
MDNVFIELLWRSLKHEDIYLKGYADGREAHIGIASWFEFYNNRRPRRRVPPLGASLSNRSRYFKDDRSCGAASRVRGGLGYGTPSAQGHLHSS